MKKNFSGKEFINKAKGFDSPTALPTNPEQQTSWQEANKKWWESSPMRYDWRDEVSYTMGTKQHFLEIDRRFFTSSSHYLPWSERPFDQLIPFENLSEKGVLEIGVGHGSHAQLIAPFCQSFTGIDLTESAVFMTKRRFELFGTAGQIAQMDAEAMNFADASFDFIWSWGVIHHSANTLQVLNEMHRVLRPGGMAVVMVYHRSPWKYYLMDGFTKGILRGDLWKQGSLHAVSQSSTDGAIARYYRPNEWCKLCERTFEVNEIKIFGQKSDLLPMPAGRAKRSVEDLLPDGISRFLTNKLRFGSFLVARMKRR